MKPKIFLIILIPLIIILLSFRLIVFDSSMYKQEFKKYNIYDKVENADSMLENLLNYLKNKEQLSYFNQKEQLHLKDVKSLIQNAFILLYSLSLIALALIIIQFRKNKSEFKKIFLYSGLIIISIVLLFILLSIINFSDLFIKFHIVFFNNDLWMLNPLEDKLILLFPEQIFKDIARKIFTYTAIISTLLIILSFVIKKKVLNTAKD